MSHGLSVLPPELRLEVDRHLFTSSMANGNIAGTSGLLFSCRKIHEELMAGPVSKAHPLLEAMGKRITVQPDGAPLRIGFRCSYNFVILPSESTVSLPVSQSWQDYDTYHKQPAKLFRASIHALTPVFSQAWSILTLRLYDTDVNRNIEEL
jgi:hypothetical protein